MGGKGTGGKREREKEGARLIGRLGLARVPRLYGPRIVVYILRYHTLCLLPSARQGELCIDGDRGMD